MGVSENLKRGVTEIVLLALAAKTTPAKHAGLAGVKSNQNLPYQAPTIRRTAP